MKKLFLTLCCIACTVMQMLAADVIVTTKSERIDALVQEVSESEIRYKKANNPNGPTFVIKTEDIATVIYANGEVQAFEHARQPQQSSSIVSAHPQVKGNLGQITKSGKLYYYNGEAMTPDSYLMFTSKHCPEAFNAYKSGRKMLRIGGALLGVGVPVMAVGIALYVVGFPGYNYKYGEPSLWIPGALFMGLGAGMVTASVPLMTIGAIRKNNSHDIFNEKCAAPQACAPRMFLDFNVGPGSAGVALRF